MDDYDDPFNGDEEAALSHAIALSLQEAPGMDDAPTSASPAKEKSTKPRTQPSGVIEVSSDEENDDLDSGGRGPPTPKKSTAMGGGPIETAVKHAAISRSDGKTGGERPDRPSTSTSAGTGGLAALGLDRKKMEEERIARLAAKRKVPVSGVEDDDRDAKVQKFERAAGLNSRTSSASAGAGTGSRFKASVKENSNSSRGNAQGLPFPKGVVKKTWALGCPRLGDDIKIEEVLQKDKLELAVLSSFQWDEEFMLSKIDVSKSKIVCIAFASSEEQKDEMRSNVPKDRIRFCFPPMMPAGSMHSKLQLLKYPTYLRVVIPSGNLVPYDWGETGVMENMVFLIDLPRINSPVSRPSNPMTSFAQELSYFLKAQNLDDSLISSLSNYDFSEADRYRFIHTIGQSHVGNEWQRTGYCGLGRAVKSLGLETLFDVEIDFVVASLGSVNIDLITSLYYAAQGDDGMKEYEKRYAKGPKKATGDNGLRTFKDKFRIYFPSRDTVVQSRGGLNAGGTICVQRKWWESATFPRELIRDCKSTRPGLLMHSKIMFVRRGSDKLDSGFGYVGSANLSESAWGRLVKNKATGQPKLNCRNWECGVLIPVPGEDGPTERGEADLVASRTSIPVPMVTPGEAYGADGSKRPWLFLER
ncbi:tyrosyl-DNA phosphodiesterase-domain-containing protein [Xylariaceae sp. FL0016]|nr:tyrosyl-DNA phosphodiesterase-domain-containing protein [Xylariaceae sp. FL0016]